MADTSTVVASSLSLLFVAGIVGYSVYLTSCDVDGFAGPVAGSGAPDCSRALDDVAKLHDLLSLKRVDTDAGADDMRELDLILSKLACFKRDLMGQGVVSATLKQPFATAHDLEPVAETTARCFAKTLPERDLQLGLEKWGSRGTLLIKNISEAAHLSDSEEKEALRLFGSAMYDVSNVAMSVCCSVTVDPTIAGASVGRGPAGYEPPGLVTLREYKGYY
jgi:hypothetical protein